MGFWIVAFTMVCCYQPDKPSRLQNIWLSLLAAHFALLGAFWSFAWLQQAVYGGYLILTLFVLIWMSDTAAYFTGRAIGRHKLTPVSPNKTIEGCVGALLGAVVVGVVTYVLWHQWADPTQLPYVLTNLPFWIAVSVVIGLVSILGDLFESLLKRVNQVKDSGHILPGHGGLLDRLDSLLPTLPLFALIVMWGK